MPDVIETYNDNWPKQFACISQYLEERLTGYIRIEHVGSTSIPGMYAKPVIDLDIEVESREKVEDLKAQLWNVGYVHVGDQGIPGRESFRRRENKNCILDTIDHHLYVCDSDNQEFKRHIRFRDILRKNPRFRDEYNTLKREIIEKVGKVNRAGYVRMKENSYGDFFLRVLGIEKDST